MLGQPSAPLSPKTAVVVPYYQEKPGILRAAAISAVAQEGVGDLEIIVVDDGSPAPASDELSDLNIPAHITLKLIEQSNRGPGAARNCALDSVCSDTIYVAFLDSDDEWSPDHLRNAVDVLTDGNDFYSANAWLSCSERDFFSERKFNVDANFGIDGKPNVYRLSGDVRFRLISGKSFVHTSTVVYNHRRFADLRFAETYRLGEDISFWMELAARTEKLAVSSSLDCNSGHGIHLYGSCGWGTARAIWGLCENLRWRKDVEKRLRHYGEMTKENKLRIREIRTDFVIAALHEIKKRRRVTKDMVRFVTADPVSVLYLLSTTAKLVCYKMQSND